MKLLGQADYTPSNVPQLLKALQLRPNRQQELQSVLASRDPLQDNPQALELEAELEQELEKKAQQAESDAEPETQTRSRTPRQ